MEKRENELNKSSNVEKIDAYMAKLIKEQEKRINDRKELFSNYDYADWLIQFTRLYSEFTDNSWLYAEDELSSEDREKIAKLPLFYEGIKLYANNNYLYPKYEKGASSYFIKVADWGFEIGQMIQGPETIYYCSRTEMEDTKGYIDIIDIVNNRKQVNTDYIKSVLDSLSKSIDDAYDNGVPALAIMKMLNFKATELSNRDIIVNSNQKAK
jgi:hypothetical protein